MTTYTTARACRCASRCKDPADGRDWYAVIPDGAGLSYPCPVCGQALVPYGRPLAGSWEIEPCGNTESCRRQARACTSCYGTKQRVVCTICLVGNCNGVHNFCLECDGTKEVTCPGCEGGGVVTLPGKKVRCPDCKGRGCGDCEETGVVDQDQEAECPKCGGRGNVKCPECNGTGKPGKQQIADTAARRRPAPAKAPAAPPAAPGPAAPAMPGANIDEAHLTVASQAERLQAVAASSEQLENDLLAGGMQADNRTLSAVAAARLATATAAQAWASADASLNQHAQGAAYANSGIAASTTFLRH